MDIISFFNNGIISSLIATGIEELLRWFFNIEKNYKKRILFIIGLSLIILLLISLLEKKHTNIPTQETEAAKAIEAATKAQTQANLAINEAVKSTAEFETIINTANKVIAEAKAIIEARVKKEEPEKKQKKEDEKNGVADNRPIPSVQDRKHQPETNKTSSIDVSQTKEKVALHSATIPSEQYQVDKKKHYCNGEYVEEELTPKQIDNCYVFGRKGDP